MWWSVCFGVSMVLRYDRNLLHQDNFKSMPMYKELNVIFTNDFLTSFNPIQKFKSFRLKVGFKKLRVEMYSVSVLLT